MTQEDDPFAAPPRPWWHAAVVYQIYPRSFADSDGDGVGDLRGVIEHLDYLQALGVDVLWLSPFFPSPQVDNGYDVSDYCAVDPALGTLDDLDELMCEAHRRRLKVVADLVFNHTSSAHPWFQASRDPADPKHAWYYWRPARDGFVAGMAGAEPTNWASVWGGPAWRYDAVSGEYYLHLFADEQPDLNWHHPEVRAELARIARWWLERGIDGFRLDVINFIGKRLPLHDAPAVPGQRLADPLAAPALVWDHAAAHAFVQQLNRDGFPDPGILTVGEMPGVTVELARQYSDPERHELSMVFTFEHLEVDHRPGGSKWDVVPLPLPALKATLARWQDGLAEVGWNSLYWCNHDQPRVVSRWGDPSPEHRVASAKAWATVLHLLRGTPYVFQGEELGMTNAGFTAIEDYRDIESLRYFEQQHAAGRPDAETLAALASRSRDNARTPMQWTDGPQAGFTAGTPWLAVNPNHREINAAAAQADPASVWNHYRALIALRHELTLVAEGGFELVWPEHEQVFAYTRKQAGQVLFVVANVSGDLVRLGDLLAGAQQLPPLHTGFVVLASHDRDAIQHDVLQPWESRVYLWS